MGEDRAGQGPEQRGGGRRRGATRQQEARFEESSREEGRNHDHAETHELPQHDPGSDAARGAARPKAKLPRPGRSDTPPRSQGAHQERHADVVRRAQLSVAARARVQPPRVLAAAEDVVRIAVVILQVQVRTEGQRVRDHHVVHGVAAAREVTVRDEAEGTSPPPPRRAAGPGARGCHAPVAFSFAPDGTPLACPFSTTLVLLQYTGCMVTKRLASRDGGEPRSRAGPRARVSTSRSRAA